MNKRSIKNQKKQRKKMITKKRKRGGQISFKVQFNGQIVSGQELNKQITQTAPLVTFIPSPKKLYSLIMWDPDVPDLLQPAKVHWMAINLSGPHDILQHSILPYQGPNPPSGTTHRYFFGLFEQTQLIHPTILDRAHFQIIKFTKQHKLTEISNVVMKVSS